jgi:hypothetical protein
MAAKDGANKGDDRPKTFWEIASKPIAIIAAIVTVLASLFGYGLSQQKELWEGRLNAGKEQLEAKQKEIDVLKQEIQKVKDELKAAYNQDSTSSYTKPKGNIATGFQVTIMKSQSIKVSEDLSISVDELTFLPNPARYVVTATVLYRDEPVMRILKGEQGYQVRYPKDHGYTIEVLKADSVSAKFMITKNS